MGAASWWVDHALQSVLPTGVYIWKHLDVYLSIRLGLAIGAGVGVLAGSARLLRIAEFDAAAASVLRRFGAEKGSR
jgi:hypothetical protein